MPPIKSRLGARCTRTPHPVYRKHLQSPRYPNTHSPRCVNFASFFVPRRRLASANRPPSPQNPSKFPTAGVLRSFGRADFCSGKQNHAGNTLCIAKGFCVAWAQIRRPKPMRVRIPRAYIKKRAGFAPYGNCLHALRLSEMPNYPSAHPLENKRGMCYNKCGAGHPVAYRW